MWSIVKWFKKPKAIAPVISPLVEQTNSESVPVIIEPPVHIVIIEQKPDFTSIILSRETKLRLNGITPELFNALPYVRYGGTAVSHSPYHDPLVPIGRMVVAWVEQKPCPLNRYALRYFYLDSFRDCDCDGFSQPDLDDTTIIDPKSIKAGSSILLPPKPDTIYGFYSPTGQFYSEIKQLLKWRREVTERFIKTWRCGIHPSAFNFNQHIEY